MNAVSPISVQGVLYRAIDLEALFGFHLASPYPRPRSLYGLAAPANGARFTPKGGMSCVYMSADAETAFLEAKLTHLPNPAACGVADPTVIVTANVNLPRVIDLTDPAVQSALGATVTELAVPWRVSSARGRVVPTQELGKAAFDCGLFDAMKYPSVRSPGHACLVIFPDRLAPPAFVEVQDSHRNIHERLP